MSVTGLFIVMLIAAALAFAPLGYFIYIYTAKDGEPFGDTEPHGDSESLVLNLVEKGVNALKNLIKKK